MIDICIINYLQSLKEIESNLSKKTVIQKIKMVK